MTGQVREYMTGHETSGEGLLCGEPGATAGFQPVPVPLGHALSTSFDIVSSYRLAADRLSSALTLPTRNLCRRETSPVRLQLLTRVSLLCTRLSHATPRRLRRLRAAAHTQPPDTRTYAPRPAPHAQRRARERAQLQPDTHTHIHTHTHERASACLQLLQPRGTSGSSSSQPQQPSGCRNTRFGGAREGRGLHAATLLQSVGAQRLV